MKKLFFSLFLATAAMMSIAPSQQVSAHSHSSSDDGIYGSFYTTATGTVIPAGDNVPFELITAKSSGVHISAGGNILIKHPGDYLVTYGTLILAPSEFQLFLNGAFIPGTQQPQGPGVYHPLSTIIHVASKDSVLSVITVTGATLSETEAGDTTAYLTILKVN